MKNTWGIVRLDGIQERLVSEPFWNFYFGCFISLVFYCFCKLTVCMNYKNIQLPYMNQLIGG